MILLSARFVCDACRRAQAEGTVELAGGGGLAEGTPCRVHALPEGWGWLSGDDEDWRVICAACIAANAPAPAPAPTKDPAP